MAEQALRRDDDAPITLGGRIMGPIRHICAFFHTKEEEYRVLRDFIVEGMERGDKAFHVVDARRREAHLDFLRGTGVDTQSALARGQLEVRGWEQAYLRDDYFDQNRMLALIEETLSTSAKQGWPLTRLVANMEWALEERSGVKDIVEYETRLNYILPKYRDPVICTYDLSRFNARSSWTCCARTRRLFLAGCCRKIPCTYRQTYFSPSSPQGKARKPACGDAIPATIHR